MVGINYAASLKKSFLKLLENKKGKNLETLHSRTF